MESSDKWTKKDNDNFIDVETKYLKAQAEYTANKLLKEYGEYKLNIIANRGAYRKGKSAVKTYVDNNWRNHAY